MLVGNTCKCDLHSTVPLTAHLLLWLDMYVWVNEGITPLDLVASFGTEQSD